MSLLDQIKAEIQDNKVMVYSKSFCPFCMRTKNLLKSKGIEIKVVELDKVKGGQAIQNELIAMTNQSTVPNIFINGKHIGGNSELQSLNLSGKLDPLLQDEPEPSQSDETWEQSEPGDSI